VGSVVLNVTVDQPTASGFLTVYSSDVARPLASNLNFTPSQTVPNLVIVKVGADGKVDLFNSFGSTQVVADVEGWFPTSTGITDVSLPVRAAFYYPWFPETWTVNGVHVKYNPLLGYYDSSTQSVIDQHIRALDYGGVKVAIASWWGPSTHSENTRIPLLLQRTQAVGSQLKWTLYYEREGVGDPTVSQIQSDLNYIKSNYASSPSYAHVNGKPVIFVYNSSPNDNTCALADKWSQANATANFYVDLKVFPGYKTCSNQPDSWHQYSPAVAEDNQPGYAFAISPGFYRADEAAARLTRDPARWTQRRCRLGCQRRSLATRDNLQ